MSNIAAHELIAEQMKADPEWANKPPGERLDEHRRRYRLFEAGRWPLEINPQENDMLKNLFARKSENGQAATMLHMVPLPYIRFNPYQARQEYGDVPDLAARIAAARADFPATLGLMQVPKARIVNDGQALTELPAALEFAPGGPHVELLYGHRRFLSALG
jgi:hypothetical protein